jgi:hypothetical protein
MLSAMCVLAENGSLQGPMHVPQVLLQKRTATENYRMLNLISRRKQSA